MAKAWKKFEKNFFEGENWVKMFNNHTPGQRVFPPNTKPHNKEHQMRIEVGETVDGFRMVYLRVNSEATDKTLKKYISKRGTKSRVACARFRVNIPEDEQEQIAKEMMAHFRKRVSAKMG